jgi:hypothetical protein
MMVDQRANALTTPELPNITRLVPLERHLSVIRRQFIRGVLTGIVVSCAVAMPAFKYSNMRQRGASSQQGSGKTVVENSDAQTASRARKSAPEIAGTSFPTPVLPKPQPSLEVSGVLPCKSAGAVNGRILPGTTAHKKDRG